MVWWFLVNVVLAVVGGFMWYSSGFVPGGIMVIVAGVSELIQIAVLTGSAEAFDVIGDLISGLSDMLN